MKIAYLSKEYPPYGLNFASAIFYPHLAGGLSRQGHEVHIISQAVNGPEDNIIDGVHVHRVGPPPHTGSPITRMQYNLAAQRKLGELIERYEIELVDAPITFGEAMFASLDRRLPLILQTFAFSDMFIKTRSYNSLTEHISFRVSALMETVSLKRAEVIVANSPITYRYLTDERKIPASRVSLIWESRIDLDKFRPTPSAIRVKLDISPDTPLVLYVGWLQARKGVHVLCEAISAVHKAVPEAVVILLGRDTQSAPGGGSFKEFILDTARQHGFNNNIKIIDDFIPEDELIQLYSAGDVFVLPSLSETFGWPVIEAMACGRPVVATATGIAPEFEGISRALLVPPPGEAAPLATALIKLLSMPREARERLAAGHRQIVEERFSTERMVAAYAAVYEKAIAGHRRR